MPFDFSTDLAAILSEVGDSITIASNTYSAAVSSVKAGKKLELEGLYEEADITAMLSSAVSVEPNSKLTYKGKAYRVVSTNVDDNGIQVLTCAEESK